jgi:bifunctional DNA-binding transcriptional regulator/antitoxin component of YhaV-PrlF toxin-antitoxin module
MFTTQKITSKGQITLPIRWRRETGASNIFVQIKGDKIEIVPARMANTRKQEKEYTVFDAIRDNKGKGIKATDLVKILKKLNRAV